MMFQFRENRSRRGFTSHIGVNVITFARASHNRLNFIFYFNSKKTAAAVVVVAVEIIVVKSVAGNLNPVRHYRAHSKHKTGTTAAVSLDLGVIRTHFNCIHKHAV